MGTRLRFTREEQLFIVGFSHVVILIGVLLIFSRTFDGHAPKRFWITEGGIIIGCFSAALARWAVVQNVTRKTVPPQIREWCGGKVRSLVAKYGRRSRRNDADGERDVADFLRGQVVLAAYVAQFVALEALLSATGGPIDSPFAPMAIAIAIFTPFVANNPTTILGVLLSTLTFYAVLVNRYQFSDPSRPTKWSFVAVNAMVLVGSVVLSLFELLNRDTGPSRDDHVAEGSSEPHLAVERTVAAEDAT